jgi:hypothetical protein
MKFFVPLLLILTILPILARPPNTQFNSGKKFSGADRTITWGPWQQNPKDEFRFRTGDRYLGHAVWEHYLGFEQFRTSSKAIKLSMIRLGDEDVRDGKPPFSSPKIHRASFTISLATPIECVSICFAIFPGGVSEPKSNFSRLSAYTLTKYRWSDPGGGQGPPYPSFPYSFRH